MDCDLSGAATAVCKLQQVYDISATSMAAMHSRLLPAASTEDLKDVSRGCFFVGPFGKTSEWGWMVDEAASLSGNRLDRKMQVGWLRDIDHSVLQRVTRRIAVATNLSLQSAEDYQVANYGLAGHYSPHTDAMSFDKIADHIDRKDGNRLATMLMYLSDVEAGGATAFVNLGIAVKPRAGTALFWYNWIATKWIHERNNIDVRFNTPG
ncbi:prolyl 4-hydroxylase subunit alpha-2-like [Dermacentor silvarum]|uniref:prolyl 4-hydroxylase subunit alpha-2-like n=1 Tax=Dermacentor silvarum TaxID=543639 RepID=UPI0021007255|nr:prolyl 4-hydroxylase subunit alpha-2-like [Dermacentor silvarum]